MDAVKAFNAELSSLYEVKPPISKAKMTSLTRGAIKAIKFYKHVVQSVEKFILKCKPEYKVPGLYVIDSIVRQSRHQFGTDKDVFAPRFSKNMQQTFINLFKCPPEDKSKIIRVLNLWQKNQVFPPEVIQPLFDLADPNNPIYKELGTPVQQPTNGMNATSAAAAVIAKGSPALQRTPTKGNQPGNDNIHGSTANLNLTDPNVLQQLQQLQRLLTKSVDNSARSEQVHFDKKLLDFDYGDDEDDVNPSPRPQPPANDSVSSLLTNPEVLRQLQTLQQTMAGAPQEVDVDKMRKLQEMKQQEDEFDKHLAQTVPNLPFASECEFKPNNNQMVTGYFMPTDMNPPNPNYPVHEYERPPPPQPKNIPQDNGPEVEVITLDHDDSRSGTPTDDRYRRRRVSRSRSRDRNGRRSDRDKEKDRRRRSRSRSRSPGRRHRSRSRDRDRNRVKETKKEEKETEKDKERKKRGLPAIKKDHLSVCSTTLWVGHLSKLVHQDDLSNTFGEFGDVVSIDLIPPRGCAFIVMLRRQDAARCLGKLKGHVLHGKAITLAWAAGKGVKGKDLKDYWEGDLGVSYIPYSKIKEDIDIEMLEDGGMIDEDTMPQWMKDKVEKMGKKPILNIPTELPPGFMLDQNSSRQIDTSQPPPMPGAGLLQPPPILPLVSPFQFNNRLLGMNVPPGMMANMTNMTNMSNMPNIPIGVPPPSLMPNQLLGMGSPFQGPPGMMPPRMPNMDNKLTPPSTEANLQSLSESLMNITQPFGLVPQPPGPHDDTMDIEMEDAEKTMDKSMPLSEQLQHMAGPYGMPNRDDDRRDRRDDRNRRRSRSRDRERDRERDRDRDRERDRDRGRERHASRDRDRKDRENNRGRDRDRRDDRRDRGNRWGDRDRDRDRDRRDPRDLDNNRDDKRDREKSLNDRLREMAGMGGLEEPSRDRSSRKDRKTSDSGPRSGSSSHSTGPPGKPNEEFKGQSNRRGDLPPRGPPEEFPPPKMEAPPIPPPGMMDGPPNMMEAPPNMMEAPPNMMDGPPKMEGPPDLMEGLPMMDPLSMMGGPPNMLMEGPPEVMNDPRRGSMHRGPPSGPPDMMRDGPPDMRHGPPDMMDGPPDMMGDEMPPHMREGPPMMRDMPPMMRDGPPMMRDGPPHMRDGPNMMMDGPNMMMDGPPMMMDGPPMMMDGPPMMMDGPPDMMNRPPDMMMDGPPDMMMDGPPDMMMDRLPQRHQRGGRRDFEPRGMRGPPGPPDFFSRDDFGPRGPPMRGPPDFGQRGPPNMGPRGPRGQFFSPRGPRGGRGSFRHDGPPNFNSRFEAPFFRGSGPRGPPMFNDGPRHRFRGSGRFEDRRHNRQGPDFNSDFMDDMGPPDFMDRGPPDFMDRGPGGPPDFMDRGPPQFMDDGPSQFMDDGPPPFMDDGPPPFVDDGPSPFMDDGSSQFMDDGPSQFMDDGPSQFIDDDPSQFIEDDLPEWGPDGPTNFMDRDQQEFIERGPPQNRMERRSRWGGGSPPRNDMEPPLQEVQGDEGQQNQYEYVEGGVGQEGGSTPVRDECPPPEDVASEAPPPEETPAADDAPADQSVAE